MSLMAKYDKLVAYLQEKEYHGDPELEKMIDSLGVDCHEAEEENDNLNEVLQYRLLGKRRYYGEG